VDWEPHLIGPSLRSSFHGSPLGARPLIKSFAKRASDWAFGSMIPSPPWVVGRTKVSHLTFALALELSRSR
jgi:hypothetical protein